MTELAVKDRLKGVVIPEANIQEACLMGGAEIYGVDHLKQVLHFFASADGVEPKAPVFLPWNHPKWLIYPTSAKYGVSRG